MVFRLLAWLIAYSAALASAKFVISLTTGSDAVAADGWNNSADMVYTVLLMAGFYISALPADESHPHGHRRFESVVGLAVGLVIVATGVYILVECYSRWNHPRPIAGRFWVAAVLAAMTASKVWMASLFRRAGRELNKPALVSVGADQQADVLSTLAALIGYTAGSWLNPMMDTICSGVISIWVFKIGGDALIEHVHQLTGRSAPPDVESRIAQAVDAHPVLSGLNGLRTHYVGPEIQASLNVRAPGDLTLVAVHRAEEELKAAICAIPGVSAAYIHIEPENKM